jgi:hypothetical protein
MPDTEEIRYQPFRDALEERLRQSAAAPKPDGIPGYITQDQFARQIRRDRATLRRWRAQHIGPPFVRIGRDIYYRETAAQDLLNEEMKRTEAAAEPRPRGRPRRR